MATPEVKIPTPISVYGYVINPSGVPIPACKVVYSIINRPKEYDGLAIDKTYFSTFTNDSGYFEIKFLPELLVKIVIPSTGRTVTGIVPYQGPVEFTKLSLA